MGTTLPNRVHGMEMEWGLLAYDTNCQEPRLTTIEEPGFRPAIDEYLASQEIAFSGNSHDAYLQNGSRWYTDVGSRREYATPEEISFRATVAHEFAGMWMTRGVADLYEQHHPGVKVVVNKRTIDLKGNSWGCHENYCVDSDRVKISADSLALVGLHLATRNIFFGAGYIDENGNFWTSQKAPKIVNEANTSTTSSRPVINLRTESLAGKDYSRVHCITGDSNASPRATWGKLVTTSLVLRLREHEQVLGKDLTLSEPLHVIMQDSAKDPTKLFSLANRKKVTAHDIQGVLIDAAIKLSQRVELPEEELYGLQEWERDHADYAQSPELLIDRSDWVLKRSLLRAIYERKHLPWKSDQMRACDIAYDRVDTDGMPIIKKFGDKYWSEFMPTDKEILIRMGNGQAPTTTRAYARGRFIEHFWQDPKHHVGDWQKLRYHDKPILLEVPGEPYSRDVENLIRDKQSGDALAE